MSTDTKELEVFDSLAAEITVFVAPTLGVKVTDAESSQAAIDVAREIKGFAAQVEKKRKELVGPLNDRVKMINAYAKKISAPLEQAENHVRNELNAYAAEVERIRQAELRRIEEERREAERKAREEKERLEAELMAKQEAEAQAQADAAAMFGLEGEALEAANKETDERLQREWAEQQAQFEREKLSRTIEASQKTYDAGQEAVKNTRTVWKCKAVNLDLVPKEFLIIELNEKAVLAAKKAGVEVPGVEYWTEVNVAIGANTYVPKVRGAIRGQ